MKTDEKSIENIGYTKGIAPGTTNVWVKVYDNYSNDPETDDYEEYEEYEYDDYGDYYAYCEVTVTPKAGSVIESGSCGSKATSAYDTTGKITYYMPRPAVKSVASGSTGKLTVKWAKNTKASGYQIQYSKSKTFASGNKTVTVKGAAAVSKVLSSLTSGKTYYVRIRTYKTVSSKNYYSAWSAAKYVKVK